MRAKIVCTSSYAISESDINSLEVPSAASVAAKDVSGNDVNAFGTTLVSLDQVRANRIKRFLPCDSSQENDKFRHSSERKMSSRARLRPGLVPTRYLVSSISC